MERENREVRSETKIRQLQKENGQLRKLCEMAGIPLILIYFPQIATKGAKINKEDEKWAKEKIKEYKNRKKVK